MLIEQVDRPEKFMAGRPGLQVIDQTRANLEELFLLRHPQYRFDKNYQEPLFDFLKTYDQPDFGSWFYFPWLDSLTRYLPESLHLELRTGRNKNLITAVEQHRFYYSTVAILGLSVGSHAAAVIAMTGGARHLKLADPDNLSGDNLNRIRTSFQNVGIKKTLVAARQIFEINPYSEIELYLEGINDRNADQILDGNDVIIEETDDPYWKLRTRELARERRLPVLMGTDNGDGAIVDIERYDLNQETLILNGLIGDLTAASLKNMPPEDLPKIAAKIAGANLVVPRMLASVAAVGKTLYSWPQLGTAANMCGSLIATLSRRIIIGDKNIQSGRYTVNPDKIYRKKSIVEGRGIGYD
ncbi:MAG: ThiF family adenylyltransferase [Candidatus Vogelbacteria bacterium]|nr:ThiF family adenylyltransferase [Candidatus Vogelbacteria bacterium]